MRKRRVYISFPTEYGNDPSLLANQKKLEGVNIRFSAKIYSQAGNAASTSITVYNLNNTDLQFLETGTATWLQKQNLIQLYAGYDNQVELIASGQITNAIPQGNPDVGLNIRVLAGARWLGYNMELQKQSTTIRGLLEDCATQMGFSLDIGPTASQEWLSKPVADFSYTGTPYGLLEQIQSMCGGFSTDSDGLNICTSSDTIHCWSPAGGTGGNILVVNKNTGMIGYPQPTTAGVQVKILLNPTVRPGQMIHVESQRTPFINGYYYVTSMQHDGESRGNNWYTTLNCARVSNYRGE